MPGASPGGVRKGIGTAKKKGACHNKYCWGTHRITVNAYGDKNEAHTAPI